MDEWIEVVLIVPATVAETAGFVLAELGSEGVTLENRELDTFVAPDPEEIVSENLEVRAYFPQPEDSAALLRAIHQRMLE
ncbi:MAG: 50S ribosomal protein L11 methyltransferase, partial [Desulfuromonadales bacterium]|nr:50S ribosomal protein L11 methyltransferase [Desulfuromonadales bacterium]